MVCKMSNRHSDKVADSRGAPSPSSDLKDPDIIRRTRECNITCSLTAMKWTGVVYVRIVIVGLE